MAGGILDLCAVGIQNEMLTINPQRSFYKCGYRKYTPFSKQRFRLDFEGTPMMQLNAPSEFTFNVKRYADLLQDAYLVLTLPDIWSPIMPPIDETGGQWAAYDFKWIENLGSRMIQKISASSDGQIIQEFSGAYLANAVERDYSAEKKAKFYKMTGNVAELNDPASAGTHVNSYPNAFFTAADVKASPSIRRRTLTIPLNLWFMESTADAFPLTSNQKSQFTIKITFFPISKMLQIRDVFDPVNNFPYISPDFNQYQMQFHRFLQPPPDIYLTKDSYQDTRSIWNADIHLEATYIFLGAVEQETFAKNTQMYMYKQIKETVFYNVTGTNKVALTSMGMLSNIMFYFQRSDVNMRNEWSNYTNWPYGWIPNDTIDAPSDGDYVIIRTNADGSETQFSIGPGVNINALQTGLQITPHYSIENESKILVKMAIMYDGEYREDDHGEYLYNNIEKFNATNGNAPDGLYCYNYCVNPTIIPSGAVNTSKFKQINLEFVTILPVRDPLAQTMAICDPQTGRVVAINKPSWEIYDYNFNLVVYEEYYNILTFEGGSCGVAWAS